MKKRYDVAVVQWLVMTLAVSGSTVNGQEFNERVEGGVFISGVVGPGGGPRQFNIMIGGVSGAQFGESLLKACDANQDGGATLDEIKSTLSPWFQAADTDTNNALSRLELSAALLKYFPTPQFPAGAPRPPEDFDPNNLLARHIMTRADTDTNGWLTLKECVGYLDQTFPAWDLDGSSSLASVEFESVVGELFAPDDSDPMTFGVGHGFQSGGGGGGRVIRQFRVRRP